MDISTPLARLAAIAAMFALPFFAGDAMAAKEKFERTKPHVNIGMIGHIGQEPGDLANPDGNATTGPDSNPGASDCKPDPSMPAAGQTC
jgi:hypothetical protein